VTPTTHDRIRAAALKLVAMHGFQGTGIRQIADEAGISVATLYHYMITKEDLLEELMRESMRHLLDPAQSMFAVVTDPLDRIVRLVDLHVRKHAEENLLSLVGDTEIRSLSPPLRREMVALRDAYQRMWEDAIQDGAGRGIFQVPDVKLAAFALIEMCTGVAYWYSPGGRLSLDEIARSFVKMAISLLAGGEPSATAHRAGGSPARGPGNEATTAKRECRDGSP
jgi:AcrR family transcriptional regulator